MNTSSPEEEKKIVDLKSTNISVTITKELEGQFFILAASLGMGKSEAIAYCLRHCINSHSSHIKRWLKYKSMIHDLSSDKLQESFTIYYKRKQ
jgi:hypothetical protein